MPKSYKLFQECFNNIWNNLRDAEDTIFYKSPQKPNFEPLYESFKNGDHYTAFIYSRDPIAQIALIEDFIIREFYGRILYEAITTAPYVDSQMEYIFEQSGQALDNCLQNQDAQLLQEFIGTTAVIVGAVAAFVGAAKWVFPTKLYHSFEELVKKLVTTGRDITRIAAAPKDYASYKQLDLKDELVPYMRQCSQETGINPNNFSKLYHLINPMNIAKFRECMGVALIKNYIANFRILVQQLYMRGAIDELRLLNRTLDPTLNNLFTQANFSSYSADPIIQQSINNLFEINRELYKFIDKLERYRQIVDSKDSMGEEYEMVGRKLKMIFKRKIVEAIADFKDIYDQMEKKMAIIDKEIKEREKEKIDVFNRSQHFKENFREENKIDMMAAKEAEYERLAQSRTMRGGMK